MRPSRTACLLAAGLACLAGVYLAAADSPPVEKQREAAQKLFADKNWNDAYKAFRKIALDKDNPKSAGDLVTGMHALQNLGRLDEIDEFREAVVAAHPKDWRTLTAAAQSYISYEHHGYIVAGSFSRGHRRGGGKFVNAIARDRSRAMQLLLQARPGAAADKERSEVSDYYMAFGNAVRHGVDGRAAWKLQDLTDLTTLPDYDEGYNYRGYRRWGRGYVQDGGERGAPVDEKGDPIYYAVPKSWEAAKSDGERWRWCLTEAVEARPQQASAVDHIWAEFCRSQYGVQSLGHAPKQGAKDGTFSLHTLKDTETIAKLATGVKRFTLPKEHNWFELWDRIVARGQGYEETARANRASEYEDRRQFPKAADAWREVIAKHGKGHNDQFQHRLDQIVGNWGQIEPFQDQPAATKATFELRFRNAKKVTFEAHALKVEKLLTDVRDHLKANPRLVDWQRTQIGDIGYRLVHQNQTEYVGEKVATWSMDLKPRPNHVDERVTVETPLTKAGAYFIEAKLEDGNTTRVVAWVADTVIVKKLLDGKVMYYTADAVSGKPVEKANLEFFGWRSDYVPQPGGGGFHKVTTTGFAKSSDADGMVLNDGTDQPTNYNWLAIARKKGDGHGGADRLAYVGFSGVWYGGRYDPEYNQERVFTITDRPVYRPEHKVQFKSWVRHAKYDQPDTSDFAGRSFTVEVRNPKGDKVYEKSLTADGYGGLVSEYALPKEATLGVYRIRLFADRQWHEQTFRVEEYKKPEFEVKVDAPAEPVKLGDKIEATVQAKYYFGAPVSKGKAKVKVLRSSHTTSWYAAGRWDWFYGSGYWWYAADYLWYPGFREWGCSRPYPVWWGPWSPEQPEVVMENEMPVGPDGLIKVVIDTAAAKELYGDTDHKYSITAEVVDESRRTIVGSGDVIAARKPFSVFSWVDRGYYRSGDTVKASFQGLTPDKKPVKGSGKVSLMAVSYKDGQPEEKEVQGWDLDTNEQGRAELQIKAAKAGQYRLVYKLTDAKKNTIEGGYVFVVRGEAFTGKEFRFNDIELTADKREYADGDKLKLLINTNRQDATVLLFARPAGVYQAPKMLRLEGKSTVEELTVTKRDMPNFFVEAVTVHGGRVHTEVREVVVPPEKRVLNVEVVPDSLDYKPGQKAKVKVRLTDFDGKPFAGTTVMSVYDRSVEYISGGSNVPEIKEFFWKWRRSHHVQSETSLAHHSHNLLKRDERGWAAIGRFGHSVVEEMETKSLAKGEARLRGRLEAGRKDGGFVEGALGGYGFAGGAPAAPAAMAMDALAANGEGDRKAEDKAKADEKPGDGGGPAPQVEPTVRKNFADTAYFNGTLTTDRDGLAEVTFTMPEQTTGWKVRVWGLGHGTKVGQGDVEVTTRKDLLLRMQSPRFFVQKDEVVLSANVHNYLKTEKLTTVTLETEGGTLSLDGPARKEVKIAAGGEARVDWRVKVTGEGPTTVRMKATTDEESDAMQMSFPSHVHGMLKMESFSGVVRNDKTSSSITMTVPRDRRVPQSRLEVRFTPTLAGAMVDALPYLIEFPHGCTEQTLNRFLPSVITQKVLMNMKLDLEDIRKKRVNLNAAELGDAKERAKGWKRFDREPVFDKAELERVVRAGVTALTNMQCSDGGWGWFSGHGEHSYPHTTAVVVHGLQVARENDVALVPNVLERGVAWLKAYQEEQVRLLQRAPQKVAPWKERADALDAFVSMVLVDAGVKNADMREFLYRDRGELPVYAKALFGLALVKEGGQKDKLDMILKNCEQFLQEDAENQTAYLKLPDGNYWWHWYGNEVEANAWYLKLLSATDPKGDKASGLVKYLLNNRKHATYWNSTRDTALAIEAMAAYMKASGEDKPDLTIEVVVDGKVAKEVKVDSKNLFSFDNAVVLEGEAVTDGKHTVEVRKKGTGPVYFSAYLTNFTTEDHITRAGLEVKVNRKFYLLTRADKKVKTPGTRGELTDKRVEKFVRTELKDLATLKSGDLVEVELEIDSKNDYEYLLFEDMKASGFEPMATRSGYNGNDLGAYMELRDDRVCFFARALARGKHSVSYRLRAEIPGRFSALPARGSAMYAPELKGNSDEFKVQIDD